MRWQKAGTAYVIVRAVRLLQARGRLPGHAGLRIGSVHVHHWVHGGVLVLAQQWAAPRSACVHTPWRANLLGTGLALIAEEFDVLTSADDAPWVRRFRAAIDGLSAVGAVVGACDWRRTWTAGRPRP